MNWSFVILLSAWWGASCSAPQPARLTDQEIFARVKLGMTQSQVEKRVGKPLALSHGLALYGGVPYSGPNGNPFGMPRTVQIVYSTNRVVVYKVLYTADFRVVEEGPWEAWPGW